MNLVSLISPFFQEKLKKISVESEIEFSKTKDTSFGDYQTNLAFKLSKLLRKSPSVLAQEIVADLNLPEFFDVSVAGAGFINITFKEKWLSLQTQSIYDSLSPRASLGKKIIVEYSSPNVAKELHVGHLRSTIIGHALANCFNFSGYDVLRLNHIGDWGTAFGMLIAYIKRHGHAPLSESLTLSTLMRWYQDAKREFDADQDIYEDSKKEVVKLQSGDEENLTIWKKLCEISERGYQDIYDALDIKGLNIRGESFYNPYLARVVEDFREKGLLSISDGAQCVFLDGFKNREQQPLPLIIQKADGGYNYATTDLAAAWYRLHEDKVEKIYIVTDSGQRDHFAMIFAASQAVGYAKEGQLHHIPFGLVLNQDKKRIKTRSGEVIRLQDVLDEAVQKAYDLGASKNVPNLEKFSRAVGIGALKYADLSSQPIMDYVFDFDRMLSFDGNTVVYLLYAYVRAHSILRKAQVEPSQYPPHTKLPAAGRVLEASERHLMMHLLRYQDAIDSVLTHQTPHLLCEYLYELATSFHAFFRDCHVVGHEMQDARLEIVWLTQATLASGLNLLGISTVDQM